MRWILAKSDDPAFRRMWIQRLRDHDGERAGEGGLAQWLRLAEAVGLDARQVASCERVLPGVRFARDAYVSWFAAARWWSRSLRRSPSSSRPT
jgi:pyrroloquinoline-quinone synthase